MTTQTSPAAGSGALEAAVARIEARLAALGSALRNADALAVETESAALQSELASAAQRMSAAVRHAGGIALPLRRRLAAVRGEVLAQRVTVLRAQASFDRAIDILMPPEWPAPAYAADGARTRQSSSGAIGA
jgi:hypothetical protein